MWRKSESKRIVKDAAVALWDCSERGRVAPPGIAEGIAAMNYRVAGEIEGTVSAGVGKKRFLPHLVCSWTLDPASRRLSCAWAPPTERWYVRSGRRRSWRRSCAPDSCARSPDQTIVKHGRSPQTLKKSSSTSAPSGLLPVRIIL
jgi:hypothetical protein